MASPIADIPPELLVLVFKELLDHLGTTADYYRQLRDFSLVSRQWKAIVFNRGSFWRIIPAEAPPAIARELLQRSQSAPLVITSEKEAFNPTDAARLDMMKSQAFRLESISLGLSRNNVSGVQGLLCTPLPSLETLRIYALVDLSTWDRDMFHYCISTEAHAPRLRHISTVEIRLPNNLFRGLQSVEIVGFQQASSVAVSDILAILASCPALATLRVRMTHLRVEETLQESDPIMMRSLSEISLFGKSGAVSQVLDGVLLPPLTKLGAHIESSLFRLFDNTPLVGASQQIMRFGSQLMQLISTLPRLYLRKWDDGMMWSMMDVPEEEDHASTRCQVLISCEDEECLPWIVSTLRRATAPRIILSGGSDLDEPALRALGDIPNIQRWDVRMDGSGPSQSLSAWFGNRASPHPFFSQIRHVVVHVGESSVLDLFNGVNEVLEVLEMRSLPPGSLEFAVIIQTNFEHGNDVTTWAKALKKRLGAQRLVVASDKTFRPDTRPYQYLDRLIVSGAWHESYSPDMVIGPL